MAVVPVGQDVPVPRNTGMRESGPSIGAVGGRFLDLRADLLGAAFDLLTEAGSFMAARPDRDNLSHPNR